VGRSRASEVERRRSPSQERSWSLEVVLFFEKKEGKWKRRKGENGEVEEEERRRWRSGRGGGEKVEKRKRRKGGEEVDEEDKLETRERQY
jgi:hypothetical protein